MLVIDWPAISIDDVALLQARLFRRPAADDAAEQQSLRRRRVVGDGAGEHANAGAAAVCDDCSTLTNCGAWSASISALDDRRRRSSATRSRSS